MLLSIAHITQVNGYSNSNSKVVGKALGTQYASLRLTNRSGLLRHKQASKIYNTNKKYVSVLTMWWTKLTY